MPAIQFQKWHGTGNDFILIDGLTLPAPQLDQPMVKQLCDRHLGIGSDGLIILVSSNDPSVDYEMMFYNPDGSQSFCGNGSRAAYAFWCLVTDRQDAATFIAYDGKHNARWNEGLVSISMRNTGKPEIVIPSPSKGDKVELWDTGSPHLIVPVDDPSSVDLIPAAHEHRYNARFKEKGVNVNFVSWNGEHLDMRTYERGVEAETLSCGTGVTAAALSAIHRSWGTSPIAVKTKGGHLKVIASNSDGGFIEIRLEGPVTKVYEGELELKLSDAKVG